MHILFNFGTRKSVPPSQLDNSAWTPHYVSTGTTTPRRTNSSETGILPTLSEARKGYPEVNYAQSSYQQFLPQAPQYNPRYWDLRPRPIILTGVRTVSVSTPPSYNQQPLYAYGEVV